MRTLLALLVAVVLAGCASGTAEEAACDSQSVSIPLPSIPSLPAVKGSVLLPELTSPPFTENFSSTLNKVSNVVDSLSVVVQSLTLDNTSGDFDWVSSIDVYITASGQSRLLLASYQRSNPSATLDVNVVIDPDTLLACLESGPVQFELVLGGTSVDSATAKMLEGMGGKLDTTVNLCVLASGSVSKSL